MPSPRPPRPAATPPPGTPRDAGLFSVGAAAERLGTSTATLRAWEVRYGLGPAARTAGGHRRYSLADLDRLRRVRALVRAGVPAGQAALTGAAGGPPEAGAEAGTEVTVERLAAAMFGLDAEGVARCALAALRDLGAAAAWDQVFVPVLTTVGEHWETTGCGIEAEHLTSGIMEAALRRHAQRYTAEPGGSPPVLLAAVSGEQHLLPMTALAAALAEYGRTTLLVGALPVPSLRDAIAHAGPAAVVVWSRTSEESAPPFLRAVRATTHVPVASAGPGWPAATLDAAAHLRDLRSALDALCPGEPGVCRSCH